MKSVLWYIVFLLSVISQDLYSQIPRGGKPFPYYNLKSAQNKIFLPEFDLNQAIAESLSENAIDGKKPFPFAWNYSLDLTPANSGTWSEMPDGSTIWRIHLVSSGAFGVNVDFSKFQLNPGCMVFIYPPSQEYFFGGFNSGNNNKSANLPVSFVKGEEIVVELQVQKDIDFGVLNIGSLAHAYIDIFSSLDTKLGPSGNCNVDINCPDGEDWQIIKKAICRITIKSGLNSVYCTGTLINNVKQDTVPYLLTANHCINSNTKANSALFLFDYEADTCDKTSETGSFSLAGSDLLATSDSLDFTLLRLYDSIPSIYKPYFAGWSLSQTPASSAVTIHHPEGDLKKISIDNGPVTAEYQDPIPDNLKWLYTESVPKAFWRVTKWESGTTEGGSSGAPLFNQNKMIVGNLTGGQANCTNPINDYFSKFHMCWDYYSMPSKQLKYWLNPEDSLITSLQGFNPYSSDTLIIDPVEFADRYTLFPNPTNGFFTFETDSLDISGGLLSIYSLTGKKIFQYKISDEKRIIADVSFLEQGLYIVEFSKGFEKVRKRLLITNP